MDIILMSRICIQVKLKRTKEGNEDNGTKSNDKIKMNKLLL